MMAIVMIESRIPNVPAIIVPVLRLLQPQHVVNLCGLPILYSLVSLLVCFYDNDDYCFSILKLNLMD